MKRSPAQRHLTQRRAGRDIASATDGSGESVVNARPAWLAPLGWWLSIAAPSPAPPGARFPLRERVRRGRLAGVLLLALLAVELGALVQFLVVDPDHPLTLPVLAVSLALTAVASQLNRRGRVTAAGLLLVLLANLPLAGVPATALGGRFDVLDLGPLYLTVGSLLVAASVLAPWSVFPIAALNSAALLGVVAVMPHTPALDAVIGSNNALQAFTGPVLLEAIVALVAYFWARSVLSALRRADRAEEIAELERREIERTRELEEGVRELLAVHVHLANGNFQVRSPQIRNPLLWQIGNSLNTLIGRLARLAQADYLLSRTAQESHRLAEAVQVAQANREPIWPAPSGTPLDEVIAALAGGAPRPVSSTRTSGRLATPPGFTARMQSAPGPSSDPSGRVAPPSPLPPGQRHPEDDLPDWLRLPR